MPQKYLPAWLLFVRMVSWLDKKVLFTTVSLLLSRIWLSPALDLDEKTHSNVQLEAESSTISAEQLRINISPAVRIVKLVGFSTIEGPI